jgi:cytidine deaminase
LRIRKFQNNDAGRCEYGGANFGKKTGDEINIFLKKRLEAGQPTQSGKKVVCCIRTKKGSYVATSVDSVKEYSHAELLALKLMRAAKDVSGIAEIILAGEGHDKIRRIIPCPTCFELLIPFFQKTGKITVYFPNSFTRKVSIRFSSAKKAFSSLAYSHIRGKNIASIVRSLSRRTPLRGNDLNFIAYLRLLGLHHSIRFFLTGSKSGRSGLASLFTKSVSVSASDLDVVAVTRLRRARVGKLVLELASHYYPSPRGVWKKKTIILDNGVRRKINYFVISVKNSVIIELMVEISVQKGFTRFFNFEKNWFHQIS